MSDAPFHVVLVEPQIPPNTGNVIRLCANTGASLHLVGPMGFPLDDAKMRRAGLDYHERCLAQTHADWSTFLTAEQPPAARCLALTTKGTRSVFEHTFEPGDWLFFGSETAGLSEAQRAWFEPTQWLRLPMRPGNRSLNLSNAVAVVVYEALRQTGQLGD
ncbi:MAG: tRNA (cytidine(34)-2'-O)-methyltransferase [Burkholderiaceae bacterium]